MTPLPLIYSPIRGQLDEEYSCFPRFIINPGLLTMEDVKAWIVHHKAVIEDVLESAGGIIFRDFPISNEEDFLAFYHAFEYKTMTVESPFFSYAPSHHPQVSYAPPEQPLASSLHAAFSLSLTQPKSVFFCMPSFQPSFHPSIHTNIPASRPLLRLCRSDLLYNIYQSTLPEVTEKLEREGLIYSFLMTEDHTNDMYRHFSWKSLLGVNSSEAAEYMLDSGGFTYEWLDTETLIVTSPVLPAISSFTDGRMGLQNNLMNIYTSWPGVRDNPSSFITYGNGSPVGVASLEILLSLSLQTTFCHEWLNGDVVIINNEQVLYAHNVQEQQEHVHEKEGSVLAIFSE
ncbi:TauD/TfdA family dioxygenase [Aestuariibacter sp. AA17]|uniref:TauD/TfdA family dioxygenase n=1 Tax=Fluctibacter corallii TaxID=2984329 RepID=A0ABT3A7E0_9ALTE|nr:TauD/TfdA family dioxygenase [Aestuariibacter sp. AA17]MCV2884588.1 TauD/TfdA family dioxygenase [Aestuariibacter sp. AA17]